MFTIAAELLVGGFYAYEGRRTPEITPEWPPAPQRLFGALMAGSAAAEGGSPDETALQWLADQRDPDDILAAAEPPALRWRSWQPLADVDDKAPRALPTREPGRKTTAVWHTARWPDQPHILYRWHKATPPAHVLAALQRAALHVSYLGSSESAAVITLYHDDDPTPVEHELTKWQRTADPHRHAYQLRGIYPALYRDYCDAHQAASATPAGGRSPPVVHRGAMSPATTSYTTSAAADESLAAPASSGRQILRIAAVPSPGRVAARCAVQLADLLRRALAADLDEQLSTDHLDTAVLGHPPASGQHNAARLSILPLPRIGHPQAARNIVGVAVAASDDTPSEVVAATCRLLDSGWTIRRWINRRPVTLASTPPESWLLTPATWQQPARRWCTVLPAVLPRALSGPNSGRRSLPAQRRRLAALFTPVGLPEPASIDLHGDPDPTVGVALRPGDTLRRPTEHVQPFTHATIEFPDPISGVVALGRRRHLGLGLCLPLPRTGMTDNA